MPDQDTFFSEQLPFAQQQEIDRLCTAFEEAWRGGQRPRIEDFLPQVGESLRAVLLKELIASEVEQRQGAGEAFTIDEYFARFPDGRAVVEAGWALIAGRAQRDHSPPSTQNFSRDHDQDTGGNQVDAPRTTPQPIPEMIGRYKILRELGEGGFGRVFLAQDTQLHRQVAIKVPGQKRLTSARSIEAFLQEARTAAQLKHPGLVVVHDVQQDADYVYIVQEYIDGQDLASWKQATNPSVSQIVTLLKEVVDAVGFAHQHDLVHRDLKPANLLVDRQDHPHVADFGLAVDEDSQSLRQGEVCGTPAYMSPEQVRGLSHILDGRSDLWSIGVILYELLTDRRPFRGANTAEIFENVKRRDPKPLRQIKPEISSELERICLKCLQKRQTDRYASAAELVDDLEAWLKKPSGASSIPSAVGVQSGEAAAVQQSGSAGIGSTAVANDTKSDKQPPPRIVPKGLRSFDEHDADFFLELLPGARDRDGLPESIRFWKRRIEETDPDKTFRVGLIYGPSGCGKSSLVKAGLLPRLAPHVVPLYVEAAAEDTELRVLKGLRRRFLTIPEELSLPEVLAGIREGQWVPAGTKVCVVLDQFEQWLHARRAEQDTQLVQALRHCDGSRLQAVVMVRGDFWIPVSEFLRELEVRNLEDDNAKSVSLFDQRHALKVLTAFGKAYGCLSDDVTLLSADENEFLNAAVSGLAEDGRVVCVRLALFADMLKGKPWTTATLSQVGGTAGLGVTFLEETFSAPDAPAAHRHHQKAAQAVLKALLPEAGSEIKGGRQSYEALLKASGYAQRPGDFADLIQILDSEIRLITPTVPAGEEVGARVAADANESVAKIAQPVSTPEKYYQLTHDYLVPSLRDWLTRKQKETRRGRAELRLAERSALWNAKPENQQLPSLFEYVNIRALTRPQSWTDPQRRMMKQARRLHGARSSLAALAILLLAWGGFEVYGRVQARSVLTADPATLSNAIAQVSPWHLWARQYLSRKVDTEPVGEDGRREQLHARLAYAHLTGDFDPRLLTTLYDCGIPYFGVVRDTLQPHSNPFAPQLWDTLHSAAEPDAKRFRAGLALAAYAAESEQWLREDFTRLAGQLVKENPIHQPQLWTHLTPLSAKLIPGLETLFANRDLPETQQINAANALAVFARQDGPRLAHLLTTATAAQYEILYPLVSGWPDGTTKTVLADVVVDKPAENLSETERVAQGQRRAGAAISLLRLGEVAKSQGAFEIQDDPESLTQFVHRCRERGVRAKELVNSLHQATDVHSRFALLLALGDYPLAEIDKSERDGLVKELTEAYGNDPSSAIHGATGWLLRKWGFAEEVTKVDHTPLPYDDTGKRQWYVLEVAPRSTGATGRFSNLLGALQKADEKKADPKIYFTFVVFPPGEYVMGSPEGETDRQSNEQLHRVKLTRPLALNMYEVTWAQYDPLDGGQLHRAAEQQFTRKLSPADPAFGINWFEAVTYCRWLTAQAGQAETAQCYDDPQSLPKDAEGNPQQWPVHLERSGFRLPTEAEWEYACRSGMRTAYGFGNDGKLLTHYGWFQDNSENWSQAVGEFRPNLRGLSDMHGNLYEWAHDWYGDYAGDLAVDPTGAERGSYRVLRGGSWSSLVAAGCRAADRGSLAPTVRSPCFGFRLALSPSGVSSPAEQEQKDGAEPAGGGTEGASAEQRPEMP